MKTPPKVLLINFDPKTANNVQKTTGVEVVQGYIEDHNHYALSGETGQQELYFKYSTPTPPYECVMVFINLDNYEAAKQDFEKSLHEWTDKETSNLWRYWSNRGTLVVFFAGQTSVRSMQAFGVMAALERSSGVDKQSVITVKDDHVHYNLVAAVNDQIIMPTTKYVKVLDDNKYYSLGTKLHTLIVNKNGDPLAVSFTKTNDDYRGEDVGALILPQVTQQSTTISKIIKHFADYYELQLSDDAWIESDLFYPKNDLNRLNSEIQNVIENAQKEIQVRKEQIATIKANNAYLKDLLTQQGDTLVEAVYKVLTDILGLEVIKSDENNGSSPKEDLLVEYNGNILLEVKGTKRQNPSLKFPQQAMQHAIRQGLTGIVSTGLVLNHDRENEPSNRTLPYSDKESKELITDIHFIDTRVLHSIAINVIEGNMKAEDAAKLLFDKLGRVEYTDPK